MKILSQSGCTDDSQPGSGGVAGTAAGLHRDAKDVRSDTELAGRALAGAPRPGRPPTRRPRTLFALIGASILWGGAISGTKFALGGFAPLPLLSVELLAATAVLWAALLIRGYRPPGCWWLPLVLGLLEPTLAYLGDTVGLSMTSAVSGGEIDGLESALVVLLAAMLLRETMTRPVVLSVLAGLGGLIVLAGFGGGSAAGDLFIAGGVLSASLYTVVAKRFDDGSVALSLTTWQFTAATVVSLAVTVLHGSAASQAPLLTVAPRFWIAAALTGIGGFALSFLLFNSVIAGVDAGWAAVVLNLIPVFGVAGAVTFLGESVTGREGIGAVLVGASVLYFTAAERREAKGSVSGVIEPASSAAPASSAGAAPPLSLHAARPIAWKHTGPGQPDGRRPQFIGYDRDEPNRRQSGWREAEADPVLTTSEAARPGCFRRTGPVVDRCLIAPGVGISDTSMSGADLHGSDLIGFAFGNDNLKGWGKNLELDMDGFAAAMAASLSQQRGWPLNSSAWS